MTEKSQLSSHSPSPPAPWCSVLVTDDARPGWGLQGVHLGWAGLPTWYLPRVGQEMLGWGSSAQTGGVNSDEGSCLPSPPPCQVACSRMQRPSRCPQVAKAYPSSSLIPPGRWTWGRVGSGGVEASGGDGKWEGPAFANRGD